jgi:hypothetical protein
VFVFERIKMFKIQQKLGQQIMIRYNDPARADIIETVTPMDWDRALLSSSS